MASNLLTKRSRILGLPVGPRKLAWGRIASLASVALGVVGAITAFLKGERKLENLFDRLSVERGKELLEEGEEFLEEGEETIEDASEAMGTVANVAQAVSEADGFFGKLTAGLRALVGRGGRDKSKKLRLHIQLAQDVAVPLTVAYNQWTQLEDFPQFMKGVQAVELEEDEEDPGNIARSRWTVKVGPSRREFSAEVTEAVPDARIAWESTEGPQHEGVVSFASLAEYLTRVQVQMLYVPGGFVEKVGNIFLAARRRARKDVRLYKHYMELTGEETGAWRGEIKPDEDEDEDVDSDAVQGAGDQG